MLQVCHSHPTKPIVDMALQFAEAYCNDSDNLEIVGWYTANERVGDNQPSPLARTVTQGFAQGQYYCIQRVGHDYVHIV